jgi:pyruvate formate lyase activating enzyme
MPGDLSLTDPHTVPARFWHRLDDGRVQCDVCPRACRLHEGQRGLCFVRARAGGQVVLTSYGRSSGFCVDPVEKKPLNHFLPGSAVLSFGTAGCNLACKFCQNWDISKSREIDTLADAASHERGIKAIEVSAGYIEPGARRELYAHMDAANIDLKAFTEDFYHRCQRAEDGRRLPESGQPAQSPAAAAAAATSVSDSARVRLVL